MTVMTSNHCCFLFLVTVFVVIEVIHTKEFYYKYYSFRKKHRLARQYNGMEKDCENQNCSQLSGLEQIKCTRQCVSSHCYKEMYAWDELEEGEIDVRLSSFKGCVVNELQNKETRDVKR